MPKSPQRLSTTRPPAAPEAPPGTTSTSWFSTVRGLLWATAAYFLFSTSDAIIKLLLGRYATFQVIPFQVCFASIIVAIMIVRGRGFRWPKGIAGFWLSIRGLLGGIGAVCGFYAFAHLPMADVYALAFCAPLLVTVLAAPILGEKVGPRRWAAVIVGFLGVMVMVRPGFQTLELGHLMALLTAFSGAGTLLIMRSLRGVTTASTMASSVMAGLLVVSLPVLPFVWKTPTWADLGLMACSGLMMGTAQFCMLRALTSTAAATLAPMQYTMMVWAVVYGYVLFGTTVSPYVLAGSFIVVGSSLYTMHRERQRSIHERSETPMTPVSPAMQAGADPDHPPVAQVAPAPRRMAG